MEIGHNNPQRWQHILDTYKGLGLVPAKATLNGFLYQDFLDAESLWLKRILWGIALVVTVLVLVALWNLRLQRSVRKMTRQVLESRERLAITLDAIGDAVIATDSEGRIVRMNPVAEALTGWPLGEARGWHWTGCFRLLIPKRG